MILLFRKTWLYHGESKGATYTLRLQPWMFVFRKVRDIVIDGVQNHREYKTDHVVTLGGGVRSRLTTGPCWYLSEKKIMILSFKTREV